jgi:hypothetical protein
VGKLAPAGGRTLSFGLTLDVSPLSFATDSSCCMANEFDPYREALVMEIATVWPEEYDDWEPHERERIERLLHASPAQATQLEYVRMHTGFSRQITVTPEDLERVS